MPRLRAQISGRRLRELVDAAFGVFCRQGYERSQVADVAKLMGVATGTVYLYVEGKEALFDLVVRDAAADDPDWLEGLEVPVPTPEAGSTLEFLRGVFGRNGQWPVLEAALERGSAGDIRVELEGVVREQYRLMARHRRGLMLLLRSALEFPGLVDVFVLGLRKRLLDGLQEYLALRVSAGQVRPLADVAATVAVVTQAIVWANLERPFDPGLDSLPEEAVENSTVDLIVSGLVQPTEQP